MKVYTVVFLFCILYTQTEDKGGYISVIRQPKQGIAQSNTLGAFTPEYFSQDSSDSSWDFAFTPKRSGTRTFFREPFHPFLVPAREQVLSWGGKGSNF